jgi:catechol 2,3-dioxygenase-like lactoylglutathione lyase family enzyme
MAVQLTKDSIDLGIVVRDAEASLAFYRDTIGFAVGRESTIAGVGHIYFLTCGTSMIKLMVRSTPPAAASAPGGPAGAFGLRYWTISVANLAEVIADCEAKGYEIPTKPTELMPGVTIAMVEDPDGNWLELVQRG